MKIINLIKESFTQDFIYKTSLELDEKKENISNAIQAYIPIILGSVIEKKELLPNLFQSIKAIGSTEELSNFSTEEKTPFAIIELKNKLFGDNLNLITSKISEFSGITQKSSAKVLDVTTMKTFTTIGKEINSKKITENKFYNNLTNSKDEILKNLPVGLNLKALGFGEFWKNIFIKENKVETTHSLHTKKKKEGSYIYKIIPIILLLLAAFFLFKYCKGRMELKNMEVVEGNSDKRITTDTIEIPKEVSVIHLDYDTDLKAYQNGLEDQIITFIQSPEFKSSTENDLKEKWFDFDNINFVFGKTDELEKGSEVQIKNLTAILKEFPTTKIKIGAYTDRKGDDKLNKDISEKRANFIKNELTKQGVGTQVVSAEGYGEEFTKIDENASDNERASDRKISLRFTK